MSINAPYLFAVGESETCDAYLIWLHWELGDSAIDRCRSGSVFPLQSAFYRVGSFTKTFNPQSDTVSLLLYGEPLRTA